MARAIFEQHGVSNPRLVTFRHARLGSEMVRRTAEDQGSTYDAKAGKFLDPHWGDEPSPHQEDLTVVGGAHDPSTNKRVPTVTMLNQRQFTADAAADVISKADHLQKTTPQNLSAGSWEIRTPPEHADNPHPRTGQIDLDVGNIYSGMSDSTASDLADSRGEEAAFATNPGREIPTPTGERAAAARKSKGQWW